MLSDGHPDMGIQIWAFEDSQTPPLRLIYKCASHTYILIALIISIRMGRAHSNNSLKHPRVDPSANNNEVIGLASGNGHLEVVRLLLSHPKVNPSANDSYALKGASDKGYTKIVKLLLSDPRVDP